MVTPLRSVFAPLGRRLAAVLGALILLGTGMPSGAQAAVTPDDYTIDNTIQTHFYELSVRHITTGLDTAYVTPVIGNQLATLGWDFTVATVDASAGSTRFLGSLPLPAGARVLDYVLFPEMQRPGAPSTVMVAYAMQEGDCRYSVLRESTVDITGAVPPALGRIWYRSPCFPTPASVADYGPLAQSGGRVALVPKAWRVNRKRPEFFFSIGDFKVAKPKTLPLSKAARSVISSVLRITAPQKATVWSSGLRNVQGLTVATIDGKQQLLSTEHGPRGGDELNALAEGEFYGWPQTDYGVAYGANQPGNTPDRPGVHLGKATLPLFAWVPSSGTGPMIQVKGPAYRRWWANTPGSADLLVAGMGSRWLYRFRIQDGAVRYMEDFRLGARVRSMAELPSGAIAMGLDAGGDLLIVEPSKVWDLNAGSFAPTR